jgi:hypothetical protein
MISRWLLLVHDRAVKDEILPTHGSLLDNRLATDRLLHRRDAAKGRLQLPSSGILRALDPESLETASCQCYEAMKRQYDPIVG